jgi:transposase
VRDYVRRTKTRRREVFVPLAHPPGHAQIDFGEAVGIIGGQRLKLHVFCCHLPHSDAFYLKAYRTETQEALLDAIASAFGFFGGVPQSVLLDNMKLAVKRILPDGRRERTLAFTRAVSHFVFEDRYGRPGRGNDKGNVEALVKFSRRDCRNFCVRGHYAADGGRRWLSRKIHWTSFLQDVIRGMFLRRMGLSMS